MAEQAEQVEEEELWSEGIEWQEEDEEEKAQAQADKLLNLSVEDLWDNTPEAPKDWSFNMEDYAKEIAGDANPLDAFLISTRKELRELGTGAMNLYDEYIGDEDEDTRRRTKEDDILDQFDKAMSEEHPVSSFAGSMVPYLLPGGGGVKAANAIPKVANVLDKFRKARGVMPALARFASGVGLGAAEGALWGGLHQDQTAAEGAAYGAGGRVVGDIAGKLGTAGKGIWNEAQEELIDWAKRNGMELDPGFKMGLPGVTQTWERLMGSREGANTLARYMRNDQEKINRLVTAELDDPVAEVSRDWALAHVTRISEARDEFMENLVPMPATPKIMKGILDPIIGVVKEKYQLPATSPQLAAIKGELQLIYKKFRGGQLTGPQFNEAMKDLAEGARGRINPNTGQREKIAPQIKTALKMAKDTIKQMMEDSNPGMAVKSDKYNLQIRLANDIANNQKSGNIIAGEMDTVMSPTLNKVRQLEEMREQVHVKGFNPVLDTLVNMMPMSGYLAKVHMKRPRATQAARDALGQIGVAGGISTNAQGYDPMGALMGASNPESYLNPALSQPKEEEEDPWNAGF